MNHFLKWWLTQINVFPTALLFIWIICTKTQILLIDESIKRFNAIYDDKFQFLINLGGHNFFKNIGVIWCTVLHHNYIFSAIRHVFIIITIKKMMPFTTCYASVKCDLKWSPNILKYECIIYFTNVDIILFLNGVC